MLNKLLEFQRAYRLIAPCDRIFCGISGGADSVALLQALYLLRDRLDFQLCACHFNHHLRGGESDRDQKFVEALCCRFDIPLTLGEAWVKPGPKGLEAAAREARYAFFRTLDGKIATAHTADDNAETVLLRMIRGTGLKGLGAIAPVSGQMIRPMLGVTRQEVLAFLEEYHLPHVEDSSNASDDFLRNRVRHGIMPLLQEENPKIGLNLSQMALRLQEDERALSALADAADPGDVPQLRKMQPAVRSRVLERFLREAGVKEPESEHIRLVEALVFSEKPSARISLPGGIQAAREYDRLVCRGETTGLPVRELSMSCRTELPEAGMEVRMGPACGTDTGRERFVFRPKGAVVVRSRLSGDGMRLPGGTKSLKKLFSDLKIPASRRMTVPVVADDLGVVGVWGIGPNLDRQVCQLPAVCVEFTKKNLSEDLSGPSDHL